MATIKEKTTINGRILTFRRLPKPLIIRRLSAVATSCVPRREISRIVAKAPSDAAPVNVTIVVTVVVVTVEIMADNRALFRCQDAYKVC